MKRNKITLALSSILLSVSLVGCSSGDGLNRSAKDGKENEVEKAAIKLVKATKTGDYNLISADELKKSIDNKEDMILINTIPSDRFEKTKIKGAVNAGLPKEMKDLKPEEKEAFLKTLGTDKDKKIVLGGAMAGKEAVAQFVDQMAIVITLETPIEKFIEIDFAYSPTNASVWNPLLVTYRKVIK